MLIGICGPLCSGKNTLAHYLVKFHGFIHLKLERKPGHKPLTNNNNNNNNNSYTHQDHKTPTCTPTSTVSSNLIFHTAEDALNYVMKNWTLNFVLTSISTIAQVDIFRKRPFWLLLSVEAPLLVRYHRWCEKHSVDNSFDMLNTFIAQDDLNSFAYSVNHKVQTQGLVTSEGVKKVMCVAALRIVNASNNIKIFWKHLEGIDIVNKERVRPSWDTYFMRLCDLAATRSNCKFKSFFPLPSVYLLMVRTIGMILLTIIFFHSFCGPYYYYY